MTERFDPFKLVPGIVPSAPLPVTKLVPFQIPNMRDYSLADWMVQRLESQVVDFQKGLSEREEVGITLGNFGQVVTMALWSIGYHNPDLIVFQGERLDGSPCTLLQHTSQVSLLLVKLLAPEERKPFRFEVPPEETENTDGEP